MSKCIVIGGGIAGLSAAAYLSKHGLKVTLFEATPKAGGRAYSFKDSETGDIIDNGQHILMGCYKETINFLNLVGAKNQFKFNNRLDVNFLKPSGEIIKLRSLPQLYPLNLLFAILKFKAISFKERTSVVKFVMKLPFISHEKLAEKNVREWLIKEKQSENCIKSLWKIITVGALNSGISKASALMLREILMKIFFNGNFASTIILPGYGLTESYVDPAINYIKSNGGVVKLSAPVEELVADDDKITAVTTKDGLITEFDSVISAVNDQSITRLIPSLENVRDLNFEHSTIINIHIWLSDNQLTESFYGLIDSSVHWIFNKNSHLNLVISDADHLLQKTSEEIFQVCAGELEKFLNIRQSEIVRYKIIREKNATIVPSIDSYYLRPSSKTKLKNFFLAGDWTDTGLPSTLEGAVKSGRIAAENVIMQIKNCNNS